MSFCLFDPQHLSASTEMPWDMKPGCRCASCSVSLLRLGFSVPWSRPWADPCCLWFCWGSAKDKMGVVSLLGLCTRPCWGHLGCCGCWGATPWLNGKYRAANPPAGGKPCSCPTFSFPPPYSSSFILFLLLFLLFSHPPLPPPSSSFSFILLLLFLLPPSSSSFFLPLLYLILLLLPIPSPSPSHSAAPWPSPLHSQLSIFFPNRCWCLSSEEHLNAEISLSPQDQQAKSLTFPISINVTRPSAPHGLLPSTQHQHHLWDADKVMALECHHPSSPCPLPALQPQTFCCYGAELVSFEDAIGNEWECFSLGIEMFSALGCAMCMDRQDLERAVPQAKDPKRPPCSKTGSKDPSKHTKWMRPY